MRYRFFEGDIADRAAVERALDGCDVVVNFAAETHVDRSILDPDAFVKTDVLGTWTLAQAARTADVQRFLQVSTDEVYGAVLGGASTEVDLGPDPTSPTRLPKRAASCWCWLPPGRSGYRRWSCAARMLSGRTSTPRS